MRLRRVEPSDPGYSRRRRGRGFSYYDQDGNQITDPATVARLRALAMPPAWRDVWICALPLNSATRRRAASSGRSPCGTRQGLTHLERDGARRGRTRRECDRWCAHLAARPRPGDQYRAG
ncbi:MAG TPA: hypothetical protein VJT72_12425 [Pseudonocardiaceae bacterium]|nr:hypothetical protein [Pseudonocardiaceae bacterium]